MTQCALEACRILNAKNLLNEEKAKAQNESEF